MDERSDMAGEWFDKLAIRELLERYMRYNDDRAADRIADLFEEDAVMFVMGRAVEGREAIRSMFTSVGGTDPARWTDEGRLLAQPGSIHLSSNPVIDIDGDSATAETDFCVIRRDASGLPVIAPVGRYRDRLRRQPDGRWRISVRVAVSVAKEGSEGSDADWRGVLAELPAATRARLGMDPERDG